MIRACAALALAAVLGTAAAQELPSAPSELKSGIEFAGPDVRAMQADDFANPGMLWVARGQALWSQTAGRQPRGCGGCHEMAAMRGVAPRYPAFDAAENRVIDLEGRINQCREKRMAAPPLAHESDGLLALTAFVAHQSRGMPLAVSIEGPARRHFEAGRALYLRRVGQMNLSCHHCHDLNWGKRLLAETVSQGHGNAYPAYRLEWQRVGSLARRIRACLFGVRARMWPYGAQEYVDLELYLAWRASGLAVEAPGVRR